MRGHGCTHLCCHADEIPPKKSRAPPSVTSVLARALRQGRRGTRAEEGLEAAGVGSEGMVSTFSFGISCSGGGGGGMVGQGSVGGEGVYQRVEEGRCAGDMRVFAGSFFNNLCMCVDSFFFPCASSLPFSICPLEPFE